MNQTSENPISREDGVFSTTDIVLSVVDAVLIVVIVVGNSLTLRAVSRVPRLRSPTGVAIACLAVADLNMGVVYTPARFAFITWPSRFVSRAACIGYIFVVHVSALCAIGAISLLSIERGYAVQFPRHYQTCLTTKRSIAVSLFAFVVIFCLSLPMLVGLDRYDGQNCYSPAVFPNTYLRALIAIGATILILGFLAFVRVLVFEIRHRKDMDVLSGQQLKQRLTSVRCRLMCVVYVSSLAFWLPHLLYYFYNTFAKQERNLIVFRVLSIFDLCSSAVNFFIYGVMNVNFRMAYRQILGLDQQKVRTSTDIYSTTMTQFEDSTL